MWDFLMLLQRYLLYLLPGVLFFMLVIIVASNLVGPKPPTDGDKADDEETK